MGRNIHWSITLGARLTRLLSSELLRRGGFCAEEGLRQTGRAAREESFMKSAIFTAALGLALGPLAGPSSAEAKGCLKGALVGGVTGHYAGHHGVLGAIGGCAVGHHMANKKNKEGQATSDQTPHSPNQPNGD